MKANEEHLIEKRVTYTLEMNGELYVVENVPARINEETGERYFTHGTVEQLRETVTGHKTPDGIIETPVYTFDDRAA